MRQSRLAVCPAAGHLEPGVPHNRLRWSPTASSSDDPASGQSRPVQESAGRYSWGNSSYRGATAEAAQSRRWIKGPGAGGCGRLRGSELLQTQPPNDLDMENRSTSSRTTCRGGQGLARPNPTKSHMLTLAGLDPSHAPHWASLEASNHVTVSRAAQKHQLLPRFPAPEGHGRLQSHGARARVCRRPWYVQAHGFCQDARSSAPAALSARLQAGGVGSCTSPPPANMLAQGTQEKSDYRGFKTAPLWAEETFTRCQKC